MNKIILYGLIGFVAQTIDGALGMAYGVSCNSFLLGIGIPPALASSSVKSAEVVTTFISGISHFKFGNVRKDLFLKLLVPGVLGGMIGAFALTNIRSSAIKIYVAIYLLIMGIRIIIRSNRQSQTNNEKIRRSIYALGFFGGLMDAIGGGGWGPIVTSTLVADGNSARTTIGSVNASEFFVTLAQVVTFSIFLHEANWEVVIGLMVGGVIAAPFSAMITSKINTKILMLIVGILISLLSLRTIFISVF